jgi:hypothetical protein
MNKSGNQYYLTISEEKILNNQSQQPLRFEEFKKRTEYMRNYQRIKRNTNPDNHKKIWRKNVKWPKDFQMCSACHLVKFRKTNFWPNQYICKSCRSSERGISERL